MRVRISHVLMSGFLTLLGTHAAKPDDAVESHRAKVRVLIPNSGINRGFDKEMDELVIEFNRTHPAAQVQLIRRGENFSSLRELMARKLAQDTPEIALVGCSEFPILEKQPMIVPFTLPPPFHGKGNRIPFQRTFPILIKNEEMLGPALAQKLNTAQTWKDLVRIVIGMTGPLNSTQGQHAVALPLQGDWGLWIFEALAERPLWEREAGGLKSNRELETAILQLQNLVFAPSVTLPDENLEQAIEAFISRKVPLLVGSLDLLPEITNRAPFRWKASPIPGMLRGQATLQNGSDLVISSDTPQVTEFVSFLYAAENGARWSSTGGLLPLSASWTHTSAWKGKTQAQPQYTRLAATQKPQMNCSRSTDKEVVQAHSEWIQALHYFFGENNGLTPEEVFSQIDNRLSSH